MREKRERRTGIAHGDFGDQRERRREAADEEQGPPSSSERLPERTRQAARDPHTLIFDRVYVHGDPLVGQKRGIALNGQLLSTLRDQRKNKDVLNVNADTAAALEAERCGVSGMQITQRAAPLRRAAHGAEC